MPNLLSRIKGPEKVRERKQVFIAANVAWPSRLEAVKAEWEKMKKVLRELFLRGQSEKLKPSVSPSVTRESGDRKPKEFGDTKKKKCAMVWARPFFSTHCSP